MSERHATYLELAEGAAARRDYLSAMQYGLWAAGAPTGAGGLRCDAELLLAMISLELGDPGGALAYAVGAQLRACRICDDARESRASGIVSMIVLQCPYLGEPIDARVH
jgi:hypothetical protein